MSSPAKKSQPGAKAPSKSKDPHPTSVPGYESSADIFLDELSRSEYSEVLYEKDLIGKGTGKLLVYPIEGTEQYIIAHVVTSKTKVVSKTLDRFLAFLKAARDRNPHEYGKENAPALLVLPSNTDICKSKCLGRLEDEGVELQRLREDAAKVKEMLKWAN
jgi:hypothetical protein